MRQLVNTMFISNNHPSFHLQWNKNLVKHRKVSKYCETDCCYDFEEEFIGHCLNLCDKACFCLEPKDPSHILWWNLQQEESVYFWLFEESPCLNEIWNSRVKKTSCKTKLWIMTSSKSNCDVIANFSSLWNFRLKKWK